MAADAAAVNYLLLDPMTQRLLAKCNKLQCTHAKHRIQYDRRKRVLQMFRLNQHTFIPIGYALNFSVRTIKSALVSDSLIFF